MVGAIARAYREAFAGLPREVWLQAAAMLVNRSGTMVLPFMSLYLTRELGMSAAAAGGVLSLYGLGSIGGSFLGGWLADRIGAIRVQQASLFGAGVGFVALGQVTSPAAVAAIVLVVSLVADTFRPATFAAVAGLSTVALRTRSLALLRLAANLGMSIGPAAGGFLAMRHYGLLFWADAVTSWLAAMLLAITLGTVGQRPTRPASSTRGRSASPWRDGPYVLFLLLVMLLAVVFLQIMSTLPLYWREHYRLAENDIGLLLALNTVIIVAVEMVLVRAIEHLDHMRLAAVGAFLVCLGFALMPLGRGVAFVAATIVVWSLGEMLFLPFTNAFASLRGSVGSTGRYVGAYMLAFSTALIVAPAVGTAVYQRWGGDVLWYGCGVMGVVLVIAFTWVSALVRASAWRRVATAEVDDGEAS